MVPPFNWVSQNGQFSGFPYTFIRRNFSAKKGFLSSTKTPWLLETASSGWPGMLSCPLSLCSPRTWYPCLPLGVIRRAWEWGWVLFCEYYEPGGFPSCVFQSIAVVHFDASMVLSSPRGSPQAPPVPLRVPYHDSFRLLQLTCVLVPEWAIPLWSPGSFMRVKWYFEHAVWALVLMASAPNCEQS